MEGLGLKVKKENGEETRQLLLENNILDTRYEIKETQNSLIFPLTRKKQVKRGKILKTEFKKRKRQKSIEEKLKSTLNKEELKLLPSSYDLIGDILVLDLKKELIPKENEIGKAFLEKFKNVNVVVQKEGPVQGEFRIQEVRVITGEDRTETTHKENNCKFKVDINKVFYTPRMARERKIVSKKVKNSEKVVDMFAGVGPFSIPIAKQNEVRVASIEKNKEGYKYLKENIELNEVKEKVRAYLGDCREVIKKEDLEKTADRIIMNFPEGSERFLSAARRVANSGATIHFYHFSDEEDLYEEVIELIKDKINDFEVLDKRTCGQIAPRKYRVCIDFEV